MDHEMGIAASTIKIRVEGSVVYLTGHVSKHEDHDLAHRIVSEVSGVTSVNHDGLEVH
jgi:osmotically-inducible protein OsmY